MDTWPGYFDEQLVARPPSNNTEKGKGKAEDSPVDHSWRYPVLEHGSLGAATLKQSGKHYEWSFVAKDKAERKLFASDNPLEVSPPTRPRSWFGPKASPVQQAEQGAHFIRTFYPDADLPTELVREEVTRDARIAHALKNNDPFSGNMLEVASFRTPRMRMAYLAFPMGETNCQLNLSPLVTYAGREAELKPTASPIHTFSTPIRQIVVWPSTIEIGKGKPSPMLGVRTMGAIMFLQTNLSIFRKKSSVDIVPLTTVERSDIGDRHAVDMAISPVDVNTGFIANNLGDIFRCVASKDGRTIERVHCTNNTESTFCRLAVCDTREKILTILDITAAALDLRERQSHTIYTVSQPGVKFTSLERPDDDYTVRLVTTEEILWLDERNTRRPLLAVKHRRDYDTTLRTQTHFLANGPLTLLTSRRNALVTVYDVARESDNLLHMRGSPYALPPIVTPDGPNLGYALFEPNTMAQDRLSVLQLSVCGSVSILNMVHLPNKDTPDNQVMQPGRAELPSDVKELGEKAVTKKPDIGALALRTHSIVDLSPAYQRLFVQRVEADLSAQSDAVFETLQHMPMFWQDTGVPVEHALTTFDIAMRSGSEPSEASRSDWFTGSSLDSVAGYRALEQGRIPRDQLCRLAPGHWDISPHIHRHVTEFDNDSQKTIENLTRYDLVDDPERTADSFRRESEARSQLALDLSLASDVFSMQGVKKDTPGSLDDDMLSISLSTQAMSLGYLEPPPVQFDFLRPVHKRLPYSRTNDIGHEDGPEPNPKANIPLGVRLLLQEWEVGTDPNQYVYRDPYDDSPTVPIAPRRSAKEPSHGGPLEGAKALTQAPAQRPPLVGSSVPHASSAIPSQPAAKRKSLVATRSQDPLRPPETGSQSTETWGAPQAPIASTQVLPGPHGGRANTVKSSKKPVKKRMGGF